MALTTRDALRLLAICAMLTLVAAAPRFLRLGSLSFYGDEDLTALAASSVAHGDGARMPSGMEYRRALPYTWLTASSARLFGDTREWSYRLPSALLGALTVPLLFLLGRWLIGERAALLAALLLAFSGWHLVFARQARMYAPFLFFYVAAAFALLIWARGGKIWQFALAVLAAAAAITMHLVGVLVVIFALLPIAFVGLTRVKPIALLGFAAAVGVATHLYERDFVGSAYAGWVLPASENDGTGPILQDMQPYSPISRWLMLAGAVLGFLIALRTRPEDRAPGAALRAIARFASATAAGALAGAGQLYGFGIAGVVFLLIHPWKRSDLVKQAKLPGALLLLIALAGAFTALSVAGSFRSARPLLEFPYPYAGLVALEIPLAFLLFAGVAAWLALRTPRPEDHGLRFAALGVLLPLAALGLSSREPGTRFAFGVYPFLLLMAGAALLALMELPRRWVKRWSPNAALAAAVLVVLSGLVGGHGLARAMKLVRLEHGEPVNMRAAFAFRPDHAAGSFVRRSRAPNDVVIAEDATAQRWYAGRVDYWFRAYTDARAYLYKGPDGRERDQYVSSAIAADPTVIDSVVARASGRVWLITSGETAPLRSYYLSPRQSTWLDSLEQSRPPAFVGRDSVTRVYCLNCGR